MQYWWWLIAVLLYLSVLVAYSIITKITLEKGATTSPYADNLFFAIASVVTLSIMPLVKTNVYG
jgi:predicted Co/Zn/Cd cation transporter (cation efflux family)